MADGCSDKTRVEVKIRPLTGYWLPKVETSSINEKKPTKETISGVSLVSGQNVAYKKDDKMDLKCVWKSDSVSSGPATPPKPSTPLPPKNKDRWEPMLGQETKKNWRNVFSREPMTEIKKKTTVNSSGCTGCKFRKRKKKSSPKETKTVEVPKEQKTLAQPQNSAEAQKIKSKVAKITAGEVLVEPPLVNLHPPTEDHQWIEHILLEVKYWAVLTVFWMVLLTYRLTALRRGSTGN